MLTSALCYNISRTLGKKLKATFDLSTKSMVSEGQQGKFRTNHVTQAKVVYKWIAQLL